MNIIGETNTITSPHDHPSFRARSKGNRKICVCIFAAIPPPVYGSSVAVQSLIGSAFSERFEVRHVNTAFGGDKANLGHITLKKIYRLIGHYVELVKALRNTSCSVVILVPTFSFPLILRDLVAVYLVRTLSKASIVGWIHSSGLPRMMGHVPGIIRRCLMIGLCRIDRFVVLSAPLAIQLRNVLPQTSICIIPNGVASPDIRSDARSKKEKITIVYMAHMIKAKGWPVLLRAAQQICRFRHNVLFDFYGAPGSDTDRNDVLKAFSDVALDPRIAYRGIADVEVRDRVLLNCEILCLPSSHDHEAQPLAILESMAAGCAVVASRIGGIPDLLNEPNGGILIEPGDENSLVNALLELIDCPERITKMGRFNREQVRQHYSIEHVNALWIKLIGEIA